MSSLEARPGVRCNSRRTSSKKTEPPTDSCLLPCSLLLPASSQPTHHHARALVGLAVEGVGAGGVKLHGVGLARGVEVVLVGDGVGVHASLQRNSQRGRQGISARQIGARLKLLSGAHSPQVQKRSPTPPARTHRHLVLIEHHVVGEASVVGEGDGLAGLHGHGGGLEHQATCTARSGS